MSDTERPITTGAAPGERRAGVKSELQSLKERVREHGLQLEDIRLREQTEESSNTELFDNLQIGFENMIKEMRLEFEEKLNTANAEITKLQKQIVVMRGDASIQGQQLKVTSKNLGDLAETVDDILRDINGDSEDLYA
eukprot:Stramenopile-MAST_4_protein_3625